METICNRNDCTGCTACMNLCPKSAICMDEDECGFKYPNIDHSKCINCGLCKKICPILNNKNNKSINSCYVGYAKNKKYKDKSSSGGIFTVIAEKILKNNGIVIGALFNQNHKLIHCAINNIDELYKLQGSKYLQSDLKDIFIYIKNNIQDKNILFVGTPCQIAGLKSYLKFDYKNLITIDFICHGVPSPKLFDKYIKEQEEIYKDKLVNYNFRDKSTGWDNYSNEIVFENKVIKEASFNNDYMKLFLSNIALRDSCYNCHFKLGNKYSDITLGDFWNVKKFYIDMYSSDGTSAIIINTRKGSEIFSSISNKILYKKCKIDEIVDGNASLVLSPKKHKKRKEFFKLINNYSCHYLSNKYINNNSFLHRVKRKIKKIINR